MGIRRYSIALGAAIALLVAPAAATAQDAPTILSAGVTADDRLYATWSVAPGTTFDVVTFATAPDPNPAAPNFFAEDNFAGFCDSGILTATCTATSYAAQESVARDRRYFAKVSAEVGEDTGTFLTSSIWVIDEAKPLIPGLAPPGELPVSNLPVGGRSLGTAAPPPRVAPPPPPPAAPPAAAIKLLAPPRTIGSLLRKGVRLRVTCTVSCAASGRLTLGAPSIGTKTIALTGAGTRVLTIKPSRFARTRLRGRPRARIKVAVVVSLPGGATKRYTKSLTVRR